MSVRVRFAPSPTGFLHIGGVRTALFNWLYARHHGGQFLLRIEDTDLERSEDRYTQDILASMKWLGLHWDEVPLKQSERLGLYRQKAEELLKSGLAYKCFSTAEDLEAMREKATREGRKPQYDRTWRDRPESEHPAGRDFVIRVKLPLDGYVEFEDLVHGPIRVNNEELDDFVIVRSNGAPTYNFSCVVDDVESRMTHVIRGDDHINNTPKQLHLYRFLDFPIPKFVHLPMILGADKKKLSKRHGAVSANVYRGEGYLPEAVLNFLAKLGWSYGDQEVFTIEELVKFFDFDRANKSQAVFNTEKLLWLNGEHMRRADAARLRDIVAEDFADVFSPEALARLRSPLGAKLVALFQPKVKLLKELADQIEPVCKPGVVAVDTSGLVWNKKPDLKPVLQAAVKDLLNTLNEKAGRSGKSETRGGADAVWGSSPALESLGFSAPELDALIRATAEKHGVKLGDLAQPMRLAVTGRMVSAGLFELLAILPWELSSARLAQVETY